MTDVPANVLVIEGLVVQPPEIRVSPAGIPISRFAIEHLSMCEEAGLPREVRFRLAVVATGEDLRPQVAELQAGRRIRVQGFLARAGFRSAEHSLVLHAQSIEILHDANR
ncbi:MAG: primosomal replication protein N [Gammaproteobacteria bacterium]|nr:primosomal replication protein N [Gammaproteobacteria bacterium]